MNLFVTESVPDDREFELTGQEAVHAVRVLRLSPGDPVYATNGEGVIYQGVVSYAGSDRLRAEVVERRVQPVPSPDVILAIGEIKKRDRMEFAVERSEEHTSELQSRGHLVCRLLLLTVHPPPLLSLVPTRRSSDLGDPVYATNGEGVIYQGVVSYAGSDRLRAEVVERRVQPVPSPDVILAIGEIKKRDRMEFAVEKAVELGVRHLVIWQGDHSLPRKLRVDRKS